MNKLVLKNIQKQKIKYEESVSAIMKGKKKKGSKRNNTKKTKRT